MAVGCGCMCISVLCDYVTFVSVSSVSVSLSLSLSLSLWYGVGLFYSSGMCKATSAAAQAKVVVELVVEPKGQACVM